MIDAGFLDAMGAFSSTARSYSKMGGRECVKKPTKQRENNLPPQRRRKWGVGYGSYECELTMTGEKCNILSKKKTDGKLLNFGKNVDKLMRINM